MSDGSWSPEFENEESSLKTNTPPESICSKADFDRLMTIGTGIQNADDRVFLYGIAGRLAMLAKMHIK